jgi:hypothetical protein
MIDDQHAELAVVLDFLGFALRWKKSHISVLLLSAEVKSMAAQTHKAHDDGGGEVFAILNSFRNFRPLGLCHIML